MAPVPGLVLALIEPGLKILLVQIFVIDELSSAIISCLTTIAFAVLVLMLVPVLVTVACFIAIACSRSGAVHGAVARAVRGSVAGARSTTAVVTATVATTLAGFNNAGSCSYCDRQQDAGKCCL